MKDTPSESFPWACLQKNQQLSNKNLQHDVNNHCSMLTASKLVKKLVGILQQIIRIIQMPELTKRPGADYKESTENL